MKTNTIHVGGRKSVCPDDIMLLEANENYTLLYLQNGKKLLVATTLKKLEKRFDVCQNFFRPGKSHIVNLNYLSDYQANNNEILMQNQKIIFVSRRRKNTFQLKIASHE